MIDLSGLTAEAKPIVRQVAEAYLKHTAPWFIGLLVHGSAVKGGIIPNCSDIDVQLYLDRSAFSWHGQLPLQLAFAIREELAGISLEPFRYIQCHPRTGESHGNLVGPIPGAYHLVAGTLPIAEATDQDLRESASRAMAELNPAPTFLVDELLGPGGVRLERSLRLLCTKVWPTLYQVLTLYEQEMAPVDIWCLPKEKAIDRLPGNMALQDAMQRFYRAVWTYYPSEDSLEAAFSLIESGTAFLETAKSWWAGFDGHHSPFG